MPGVELDFINLSLPQWMTQVAAWALLAAIISVHRLGNRKEALA
jgi:hypothetical protein